jgi:hypothetical protein
MSVLGEKDLIVEDAQRLAFYTSLRTINSMLRPPDGFGNNSPGASCHGLKYRGLQ